MTYRRRRISISSSTTIRHLDDEHSAATAVTWTGKKDSSGKNVYGLFPKPGDKDNVWSTKGKGDLYPDPAGWKTANDEGSAVVFQ